MKAIRGKLPKTRILVLAILPRGEQPGTPDREEIATTNRLLAHLDDGRRVRVLDVGSRLLEPDGRISPETMADFLHPTPRGFRVIAEAMAPLLEEMVGR